MRFASAPFDDAKRRLVILAGLALVICTEWEQFRALDLDRLKTVMAGKPAIVDLRNIYSVDEMAQRGFVYESIGRARSTHRQQYPLYVDQPHVPLLNENVPIDYALSGERTFRAEKTDAS